MILHRLDFDSYFALQVVHYRRASHERPLTNSISDSKHIYFHEFETHHVYQVSVHNPPALLHLGPRILVAQVVCLAIVMTEAVVVFNPIIEKKLRTLFTCLPPIMQTLGQKIHQG